MFKWELKERENTIRLWNIDNKGSGIILHFYHDKNRIKKKDDELRYLSLNYGDSLPISLLITDGDSDV